MKYREQDVCVQRHGRLDSFENSRVIPTTSMFSKYGSIQFCFVTKFLELNDSIFLLMLTYLNRCLINFLSKLLRLFYQCWEFLSHREILFYKLHEAYSLILLLFVDTDSGSRLLIYG